MPAFNWLRTGAGKPDINLASSTESGNASSETSAIRRLRSARYVSADSPGCSSRFWKAAYAACLLSANASYRASLTVSIESWASSLSWSHTAKAAPVSRSGRTSVKETPRRRHSFSARVNHSATFAAPLNSGMWRVSKWRAPAAPVWPGRPASAAGVVSPAVAAGVISPAATGVASPGSGIFKAEIACKRFASPEKTKKLL